MSCLEYWRKLYRGGVEIGKAFDMTVEAIRRGEIGETRRCSTCRFYLKRWKRSGHCVAHSVDVTNAKTGQWERAKIVVRKYHVCNLWEESEHQKRGAK